MDRRRVVVLVLDGLGVGAMEDVGPEDRRGDTLGQVFRTCPEFELPVLGCLGLGNIPGVTSPPPVGAPEGAFGRCALAHPGADTYLGHQELMGAGLDTVEYSLLADVRDTVAQALQSAGYVVQDMLPGQPPLLVEGCVLVADNIEAKARLNINVTASLDDIDFDSLTGIGEVVRKAVRVPRVIVVGGRGYDVEAMRRYITERSPGQIGVDTPALGVYDEHYQVRHLGVDLETDRQLATRVAAAGMPVVLLGKAADVVHCAGAEATNIVATADVLDAVVSSLHGMDRGLVVANVQETDLAGREQDPHRFADVLAVVDGMLPRVLGALQRDDLLLITADHGNDPTTGSSQHTREYTPLLALGPAVTPVELGTRPTLADIGCTAAEHLEVGPLATGRSFMDVLCVA